MNQSFRALLKRAELTSANLIVVTGDKAAEYWRLHVPNNPYFNSILTQANWFPNQWSTSYLRNEQLLC